MRAYIVNNPGGGKAMQRCIIDNPPRRMMTGRQIAIDPVQCDQRQLFFPDRAVEKFSLVWYSFISG